MGRNLATHKYSSIMDDVNQLWSLCMERMNECELSMGAMIMGQLWLWRYELVFGNKFQIFKVMSKHSLILYSHEHGVKCEICIQTKITEKHFSKKDKSTQLLELVHSNICELNGVLTRGSLYILLIL